MSHEPKPSEHAMRAANKLYDSGWIEFNGEDADRSMFTARYIDQHAIAPAVAERDRRIKELEDMLNRWLQWAKCLEAPSQRGIFDSTRAVLAKSERSAP